MKKLLILAVFTVFLSGCSAPKDGRVHITYQTMETLPQQRRALSELVSAFEKKYPAIKVDVLTSTTSFQKLSVQIAGGNAPDVFYYITDRLPGLVKHKAVMDITPFMDGVDKSAYFKKALETAEIGGRYYLFPFHFSTDILFYNKDLFDEAGMDYPDGTWTWEDFLRAAVRLTKEKDGRIIRYGALLPRPLLVIKSFGGKCFSRDMKRCALNSQETKKALRFLIDLKEKYHAAPSGSAVRDTGKMDGMDMFSSGRAAMFTGRTFMLAEFRKLKSFNWDIAPVPAGARRYSRLAVGGNCIGASCAHPEAAWKFVKFFSGKEGSYICGMSGNCVPALKEAAHSDAFLVHPPAHAGLFVDSIADAESDNPGLAVWEEFYQRVVQGNIDKILNGVVTIEDGLCDIEREGTELLSGA